MGERDRKGIKCRVLVRGKRNSILVELEDGEKVVTSRYAVREERAEVMEKTLNPKMKPAIQRTLVQKNPEGRFRVQGYHTGDFLGSVVQGGFTGAEFVIERIYGPKTNEQKIGERVWVPFANYVTLTLDNGGVE
jgi:hypothetical protein